MVPPGVLLFGAAGAVSAKARRDAARASERAASGAAERLAGARTVRAFARELDEDARYANALEEAAAARGRATQAHAVHLALFAAVPSTAVAAWLWYGGRLVERGRLTVGELTTVVPLALEVAGALASLSELSAKVQRGVYAADRAAAVLGAEQKVETGVRRRLEDVIAGTRASGFGRRMRFDRESRLRFRDEKEKENENENEKDNEKEKENENETRGSRRTASRPLGAISFRDVRFSYPSRPDREVLRGFDLELKPGEVFALVGCSGGGKSTVGALLERFYDPDSGIVSIDGVPVKEVDLQWLRSNVGTVSQNPTLFDGTIEENIRYAVGAANETDGEIGSLEAVVAAARVANAHEFILLFPDGYRTRVGENGALLSGGQKQRIAIARVVLANPSVLLLDEATSALDAESEAAVSEALARLSAAGRTTILVAHRLSTVRRADRVGVLRDGRLVECGTHDELMRKRDGAYRALVETQLAG
jgi:ABC-type multidrug transport system fused ATPase/permease subunit